MTKDIKRAMARMVSRRLSILHKTLCQSGLSALPDDDQIVILDSATGEVFARVDTSFQFESQLSPPSRQARVTLDE